MRLSNDVDVTIQDANCQTKLERIDTNRLRLTLTCKCEKTKSTYEIMNPKTLLGEKIHETLALIKEGKREPLPKAITRVFTHYCNQCGRQNTTTLKYTLTNGYLKRLHESLNHATDKRVYKDLIEIETELKGAHFPDSYGDARDLLFAVCGSCLQTTPIREAVEYFESLTDSVETMLKEETYPKPRTFKLKLTCIHCLKPIEAKTTISVIKPKNTKELLDMWEQWRQTEAIKV